MKILNSKKRKKRGKREKREKKKLKKETIFLGVSLH